VRGRRLVSIRLTIFGDAHKQTPRRDERQLISAPGNLKIERRDRLILGFSRSFMA
jgi:hypothetical protein